MSEPLMPEELFSDQQDGVERVAYKVRDTGVLDGEPIDITSVLMRVVIPLDDGRRYWQALRITLSHWEDEYVRESTWKYLLEEARVNAAKELNKEK